RATTRAARAYGTAEQRRQRIVPTSRNRSGARHGTCAGCHSASLSCRPAVVSAILVCDTRADHRSGAVPGGEVTMSATALAGAFAGGAVSLLSPCVLPVVPAYLSITTGLGMSAPPRAQARSAAADASVEAQPHASAQSTVAVAARPTVASRTGPGT